MSREAFEAWRKDYARDTVLANSVATAWAWEGWQAARKAALLEAVEVCKSMELGKPGHTADHPVVLYRGDVAAAIRAMAEGKE